MQEYRKNKLKTVGDIVRRIDNWPEALSLRMRRSRPGLSLLRFRNGMNLVMRGNTRDWDVVHELVFKGAYTRAFEWLRRRGRGTVLDFGGNIGVFSILAARSAPEIHVEAFEPGPPNCCLFEMNRLANGDVSDRIALNRKAVGGSSRTANWVFDEANPGGSSLYSSDGVPFMVEIVSMEEIVAGTEGEIALAKIDVEGAEYEILEATPEKVWKQFPAVAVEIHEDPRGIFDQKTFIERMGKLGFRVEQESVATFFLSRSA